MKLFESARRRLATPPALADAEQEPEPVAYEAVLDAQFLLHEQAFARALDEIDAALAGTPTHLRPGLFADIPADVFALLCLHRPDRYPNLASWLPRMPHPALQLNSTGSSGQRSMLEASRFVSAVARKYVSSGQPITSAKVLDFGVCWARIARLFYQHVPTDRLYGVDAWGQHLEAARACGFAGQLAIIGEIPSALPFAGVKFDLVAAFSVFTHLSPTSARAAIAAIRSGMSDQGLLALTLRPRAFTYTLDAERRPTILEGLASTGFGYYPEPYSKGELYGDAVVDLDYVRDCWTDFELAGVGSNAADPYQLYVFLRPR